MLEHLPYIRFGILHINSWSCKIKDQYMQNLFYILLCNVDGRFFMYSIWYNELLNKYSVCIANGPYLLAKTIYQNNEIYRP